MVIDDYRKCYYDTEHDVCSRKLRRTPLRPFCLCEMGRVVCRKARGHSRHLPQQGPTGMHDLLFSVPLQMDSRLLLRHSATHTLSPTALCCRCVRARCVKRHLEISGLICAGDQIKRLWRGLGQNLIMALVCIRASTAKCVTRPVSSVRSLPSLLHSSIKPAAALLLPRSSLPTH